MKDLKGNVQKTPMVLGVDVKISSGEESKA
jgi:hypothetical protein